MKNMSVIKNMNKDILRLKPPVAIEKNEDVPVSNLLFDLTNPRLAFSRKISNQNECQKLLVQEFEIEELVKNMLKIGFKRSRPIIVTNCIITNEKIKYIEKFIIIDGNRRVTAVKEILKISNLDANIRKEFERIPAIILDFGKNPDIKSVQQEIFQHQYFQ